jgi:hypothetical protein
MFVISKIEELILADVFNELRQQEITYSRKIGKQLMEYEGNVIDFFESNKMYEVVDHILGCRILNSLIMEICYFLQEAYSCVTKMRLSVSFTLFRKPFFEILIIQLRLLIEEDFMHHFNNDDGFNPIGLSNVDKKKYLIAANKKLRGKYNILDLYSFLFDKSSSDNLYNIGNTAIHIYTAQNPVINTGNQNLNFIFNGDEEIESQWYYIYHVMPMLLSFFADLIDLNVMKYTSVNKKVFIKRFRQRDIMRNKCHVV